MARVTVEDCLDKVDNRFDLVLAAAKRARDLTRGAVARVPIDNDKSTVVALREIAEHKYEPGEPDEHLETEEELMPGLTRGSGEVI